MKKNITLILTMVIVIVVIIAGSFILITKEIPTDWRTDYEPTILKENWIVTSNETYANEIIEISGNLTIDAGVSLLLDNTILVMGNLWAYPSGNLLASEINVNGEFYVLNNSKITCKNEKITYKNFEGEKKSQFVAYEFHFESGQGKIENSIVEGFWLFSVGDIELLNSTFRYGIGLDCNSRSPVIKGCIIEYNFGEAGIDIRASGGTLSDNIIRYNEGNGIIVDWWGPTIENNTIMWNQGSGIYCVGGTSNYIQFNNISHNNVGIECSQSSPHIYYNSISNNNQYGIGIYASSPYITKNIIFNNTEAGILIHEHAWDDICDYRIWDNQLFGNGGGDNWTPLNYTPISP